MDMNDVAQLAVLIRGVTDDFEIKEELQTVTLFRPIRSLQCSW